MATQAAFLFVRARLGDDCPRGHGRDCTNSMTGNHHPLAILSAALFMAQWQMGQLYQSSKSSSSLFGAIVVARWMNFGA